MEITTERLLLRNMTVDDWIGNRTVIRDFNQSESRIFDMPLPEEEEAVRMLTAQWAQSGLFFCVFLAGTSEMIGYVCFHNDDGRYDLGYCFHRNYHGRGYAYESCNALMHFLELNHRVACFTACTALENISSCHLLRRLGFTLQKTEQLSFHKDEFGNDISFTGGTFIKK